MDWYKEYLKDRGDLPKEEGINADTETWRDYFNAKYMPLTGMTTADLGFETPEDAMAWERRMEEKGVLTGPKSCNTEFLSVAKLLNLYHGFAAVEGFVNMVNSGDKGEVTFKEVLMK